MKQLTLAFVASLLLSVSAAAQKSKVIDGAVGLKWGAYRAEIQKVMASRAGTKLYREDVDNALSTTLRYQGGILADMPVILTSLSYTADEGLYRIAIAFADEDDTGESKYYVMLRLLGEKYGPGVADSTSPQLYTWTTSDGNNVTLEHTTSGGTTVRYYDQSRFSRYIKKKMKLESTSPSSDY
jgi:hypothetical protein